MVSRVVVAHTFNTCTWEAEAGNLQARGQSLLHGVGSRTVRDTQRDPLSKQKQKQNIIQNQKMNKMVSH